MKEIEREKKLSFDNFNCAFRTLAGARLTPDTIIGFLYGGFSVFDRSINISGAHTGANATARALIKVNFWYKAHKNSSK
jgi:hypothetical protein